MKEFKIGQTVRVLDNQAARSYALANIIGEVFKVNYLNSPCRTTGVVDTNHPRGYFVSPSMAELVYDAPFEFKIGQRVRILDNEEAREYNLNTLGLIGDEFTVESFSGYTDAQGKQTVKFADGRWNIPVRACELLEDVVIEDGKFELTDDVPRETMTPFQRVAEMNTAFGNPKGDFQNVDWDKIRAQCKNIFDEYCELLVALGQDKANVKILKATHNNFINPEYNGVWCDADINVKEVRDALCDIPVFSSGAQHLMGVDADADMHAVVDGVMTRFIKSDEDKAATIALHAKKGVTDVYFEGEYPKLVMKSAVDQPDAPKGKFLKSASYQNTVFPAVA